MLRDELPSALADERNEQPALVAAAYVLSVLGRAEEPQPVAGGVSDEALRHCLTKQPVESLRVAQVQFHDVSQIRRVTGGHAC